MRRPVLLLALALALAVPASLRLPSTRVATGQSCAMACGHGDARACCCASGGAAASFSRCAPGDDAFVPASSARALAPPALFVPGPPAAAGWLALGLALILLASRAERPDPVPRLLS